MNIGDIYAGKPDANDEIRERGYDEFENSYIRPTGINIDGLVSTEYGTPFFVMGDKGTGKTALLHFLEKYALEKDSAACSSFISFEKNVTQPLRNKFNVISNSINSSIQIDKSIASKGLSIESDFFYIWKWQFYQKIINDNLEFNEGLFVNDDNWDKFKKQVEKIERTTNKDKMHIPAKFSLSASTDANKGTVTSTLSVEPLDLSNCNFNNSVSYTEFVKIINNAEVYLNKVIRTDIPYYIFVDELEAYRAEDSTFYRDLRLIRDLLFVIKHLNDLFNGGTKILCSVRPEIINAINKFIQSKQLHKITQGYDERLNWEYTNTNSFNHPIIGILLKRIETAEKRNGNVNINKETIIKKWFVRTVYNKNICTYILDNTWHKPRDIVRLLLAAQSKHSRNFSIFNQNTFETFMSAYSKQCLQEVKEELKALYTASQIDNIFSCLQGFKVVFSYKEIVERIKALYPNSDISTDIIGVLNVLYRIGVIGNTMDNEFSQRWEYKEQYNLFIDEPWKMIIHPSLRYELSISRRKDKYFGPNKKSVTCEDYNTYKATIKRISYRYIIVQILKNGEIQEEGYISMYKSYFPLTLSPIASEIAKLNIS